MKKREFNLLLQIATLCLCVAAIAFGVYSAKTASLSVSGTIGFKANNCKFYIASSVTCAENTTSSSAQITTDQEKTRTLYEAYDKNNTFAHDVGMLRFNDLVTDGNKVVITLKIENASAYKVSLVVSAKPTFENGSNTDKIQSEIKQGTEVVDVGGEVVFEPADATDNSGNDYKEITITLTVDETELDYLSTLAGDLKFGFKMDKYVQKPYTKATLPVKKATEGVEYTSTEKDASFVAAYPYYIEYGVNDGNPITWHIIAKDGVVDGVNGQMVTLTDDDLAQLETGKLDVDVKYYFLSRHLLPTGTLKASEIPSVNQADINTCIAFQNHFNLTNDKYEPKNYGKQQYRLVNDSSIYASDYAWSNLRSYLKGNSVQISTSLMSSTGERKPSGIFSNSFEETYELNDDLEIHKLIQPRSLTDLYSKISASYEAMTIPSALPTEGDTEDKFWIMSKYEVETTLVVGSKKYLYATFEGTKYCMWWSRSPLVANTNNPNNIEYKITTMNGDVYSYECFYSRGVRPAFAL